MGVLGVRIEDLAKEGVLAIKIVGVAKDMELSN
jgi:hypothetical protein